MPSLRKIVLGCVALALIPSESMHTGAGLASADFVWWNPFTYIPSLFGLFRRKVEFSQKMKDRLKEDILSFDKRAKFTF